MIGVFTSTGSPFWPWQALQACSLSSMPAALAVPASAAAKMKTAPKRVGKWLLIMFYTPLFEARSRNVRRPCPKHAAVRPVAQAPDRPYSTPVLDTLRTAEMPGSALRRTPDRAVAATRAPYTHRLAD